MRDAERVNTVFKINLTFKAVNYKNGFRGPKKQV